MKVPDNIATFSSLPVGGYVSGPCWLVHCPGPTLMAMVVWGNPSRDDAGQVIGTFRADLSLGPHAYFIDARRMTAFPDPDAFAAVVEQVAPSWDLYRAHVLRCAVVLPPGMAAAVVVGFFGMWPPPFETKFFADALAALQWAGATEASPLLAALDVLHQETVGTTPLLQRLRSRLDQDLGWPTLPGAARTLAISTRLLQRRLFAAGTSYRREINAARLRKAQRLLAGTTMKITSVALEVGCASSQHLSALFKRLTGESPSRWRAANRASFQTALRRGG